MRKLPLNNIIAIFVVTLTLLSVYSNWIVFEKTNIPDLTGQAAYGRLSLCVRNSTTFPNITVVSPNGWEILTGIAPFNSSVLYPPEFTISNVYFDYEQVGSTRTTFRNYTDIDGSYYSVYWDTGSISDGNCNYIIYATQESADFCPYSSYDISNANFTINNDNVEPIWDNYKNNLTTNFSTYGIWVGLSDATIGIPNLGLINFSGQTINFDNVSIDNAINISHNHISIDPTNWLCLYNPSIQNVTLTLYNLSFGSATVIRNGIECNSTVCTNIEYIGGNLTFTTTDIFGTYGAGQQNFLDVWDETDARGGGLTKRANDNVRFFVNFTDVNATSINGTDIYCEISFLINGNYTAPINATFNTSTLLYNFNRSFPSRGNYTWRTYCVDNGGYHQPNTEYSNVSISNTPPQFNWSHFIPNQQLRENTPLVGLDIEPMVGYYFYDIDGDVLSYSYFELGPWLTVTFNGSLVTLTPRAGESGDTYIIFRADDLYDYNVSNRVNITIIPNPTPPPGPTGGGGGGGGGGASCTPSWQCTKWECEIDNIMYRKCFDINNCKNDFGKPNETGECQYIPQCFNGKKDQNEGGIDCGGPCPPCYTCFDGIQNQDEEKVDCGGPCEPCPSNCIDGIKNGEERGIDCGGKCKVCKYSDLLFLSKNEDLWDLKWHDLVKNKLNIIVANVTQKPWAAWSKDSWNIAYVKNNNLWITDRTLSSHLQVTSDVFVIKSHPSWSKDSSEIVYSEFDGSSNYLSIIDLKTKIKTKINSDVNSYYPHWSRSGKIAFSTQKYEIKIKSKETNKITGFAVSGKNSEVYVINSKGEIYDKVGDVDYDMYAPAFSPDGKLIAYFTEDKNLNSDIWLMNEKGNKRRKLTNTSEYNELFPAWSADGKRIIFAANYEGNYDIYSMDIDGTNIEKSYDNDLYNIPTDWYIEPNCYDGLKNQNETDIDCGGPCPPCLLKIEVPAPPKEVSYTFISLLLLAILIIIFLILTHKRIFKFVDQIMWKISILRKRKKLILAKEQQIRINYLEKLKKLEEKVSKQNTSVIIEQFSKIVTDLYKDLLNIDYEFTYEELQKELKNKNIDPILKAILGSFFQRINNQKFTGDDLTNEELVSLIYESKEIVNITTEKPNQEEIPKDIPEAILKYQKDVNIFDMLTAAEKSLEIDVSAAKKIYFRIIQKYNKLPFKEQKKVYDSIKRLYEEIKLMSKR